MPETGLLTVSRLSADEWQTYREVRLAMLQESPGAYGSTHQQESARRGPQVWRQRLRDNSVLLARVGGTTAGSAMYSEHGITDPGECALYGMWVDPRFRRRGVGRALVQAVVARARDEGKRGVVLYVVAGNVGARLLYERQGFVATGRSVAVPLVDQQDDQLVEDELKLVVHEDLPAQPVPQVPPVPG